MIVKFASASQADNFPTVCVDQGRPGFATGKFPF